MMMTVSLNLIEVQKPSLGLETREPTCRLVSDDDIDVAISFQGFGEIGLGILQEGTKRISRESHSIDSFIRFGGFDGERGGD